MYILLKGIGVGFSIAAPVGAIGAFMHTANFKGWNIAWTCF